MPNPFDPGYYCSEELREFGFASVGENVLIGKDCVIVGLDLIEIGSNVRIDHKCTIIAVGGYIRFGDHIHIGAHCHFGGRGGIVMEDFSGMSQRCSIYSASDDYSGRHMTNPTVPESFTGAKVAPVHIGRHAVLGSGAVVLPGCHLHEGSALGALSLATHSIAPWTIASGTPARRISNRKRDILALETEFLRGVDKPVSDHAGSEIGDGGTGLAIDRCAA